jgi:hypothetical protein
LDGRGEEFKPTDFRNYPEKVTFAGGIGHIGAAWNELRCGCTIQEKNYV